MFPFYSVQANLGTGETYLDGFSHYLLVLGFSVPKKKKYKTCPAKNNYELFEKQNIFFVKVPSLYVYGKRSKGKSVGEYTDSKC